MKRKLFMLALLAMTVMLLFAFVACGSGSDGVLGQVSKGTWQEKLSIDIESSKSFTITQSIGSSYDKSEAESYGEWYRSTYEYSVDNENEKMIVVNTQERWENEQKTFVNETSTEYYFKLNNEYYLVDEDRHNEGEWEVNKITKADFIDQFENITNQVAMLKFYADPVMMDMFEYDSATQSYTLVQFGTALMSIQFLNDGLIYRTEANSIENLSIKVIGIDKTEVLIPQEIISLV